jgi:hypothetical protein
MILEMNKGDILVKQSSLESVEHALIYLNFKDITINNTDRIELLINENRLENLKPNVFKLDFSLCSRGEKNVEVIVKRKSGKIIAYSKIMEIKGYFCLDKMDEKKLEQVFLDQNKKIELLEKKIKDIENKINII